TLGSVGAALATCPRGAILRALARALGALAAIRALSARSLLGLGRGLPIARGGPEHPDGIAFVDRGGHRLHLQAGGLKLGEHLLGGDAALLGYFVHPLIHLRPSVGLWVELVWSAAPDC